MRREEVEYGFKTTVGSPLQQPTVRGAGPGAVRLSQNRKKEKMHLQYHCMDFHCKNKQPLRRLPSVLVPQTVGSAFPGWCSRPGGWAQQPAFPPAGAPPDEPGRPRPPCGRRLAECSLTNPRPLRSGRFLGFGPARPGAGARPPGGHSWGSGGCRGTQRAAEGPCRLGCAVVNKCVETFAVNSYKTAEYRGGGAVRTVSFKDQLSSFSRIASARIGVKLGNGPQS